MEFHKILTAIELSCRQSENLMNGSYLGLRERKDIVIIKDYLLTKKYDRLVSMQNKNGNYLLICMILGAVLGVLGGYFLSGIFIEIKFLGTIFLNALKMVVVPLIIASIIVGVTSLGDIRKLGKTTGKTLLYYLATTGFSVLIGLILVNLIRPGVGVPLIGASVPEFVVDRGENTIIEVIVGLIPDNLFGAAASGKILPLIIFALIFGGVLTTIGSKGKQLIVLFQGINAAIMKIVMLIIYFAPIGIFALIGGIVAENRDSVDRLFAALGLYSLTVIIGLLIHAVIVLPLILKMFGRKNPFTYFINMGQALTTAFSTASSAATLPLTMEAVEHKNKVDKKAASFVLPLGATINMDGTALYEAVAALFIAQIYGIDLSIGAQVVIFFTATLASIGAAAIPEAGLVMMSLVLAAVGLPLEGIGIILVIDWFLDRCRTTVNVWGDSIGAAVIGETAEIKTYLRPTRETKPVSARKQPSRKSKPRVDKPVRGARPADRDKAYRPKDGRKRDRKPINGRNRPERGPRPDRTPRGHREPERRTRETVDKERRGSMPRPAPKVQPEKEIKKEPIKENLVVTQRETDDFFGTEFKKMDFFKDDRPVAAPTEKQETGTPTISDKKTEEKTDGSEISDKKTEDKTDASPISDIKTEEKTDTPTIPDKKTEDKTDAEEPAAKKKVEVNNSENDENPSDEEDMWGRGKKKRPSK